MVLWRWPRLLASSSSLRWLDGVWLSVTQIGTVDIGVCWELENDGDGDGDRDGDRDRDGMAVLVVAT